MARFAQSMEKSVSYLKENPYVLFFSTTS